MRTVAQLKRRYEQLNPKANYFSAGTLRWWGQRLADFTITEDRGEVVVFTAISRFQGRSFKAISEFNWETGEMNSIQLPEEIK